MYYKFVIHLSKVVFYVKLAFDQLTCTWYCFGNCIALGFALFWELHCNWNCIILWIALHWKLYCIKNCNVLEIALYWKLYWELHCIGNCIVLRIALCWELHCIECSLEYSRNFCGGFMATLGCCCFCLAKWVTHRHTDRDCDS